MQATRNRMSRYVDPYMAKLKFRKLLSQIQKIYFFNFLTDRDGILYQIRCQKSHSAPRSSRKTAAVWSRYDSGSYRKKNKIEKNIILEIIKTYKRFVRRRKTIKSCSRIVSHNWL